VPVYSDLEGWNEDISGIKTFGELPASLRTFIGFVEKQSGVPVSLISVGSDRNATIFREQAPIS
jgi:adenylosuccinate synthase